MSDQPINDPTMSYLLSFKLGTKDVMFTIGKGRGFCFKKGKGEVLRLKKEGDQALKMVKTTFRRSGGGHHEARNEGGKIGKTAYDKGLSMRV